ncbi:MAG: carotenoid biosynthesis protein [Anaerolineales bacterium]|nr:carotenoid biosynthesis protein [Anaerolineales bacterium]
MPSPYFLLFELIIYIQLALCLHHAWKHGAGNLLRLFAGILFGVSLELATIRQLNAYEYGRFLIMILDVPLCIGVAWGCILYSVMQFSDGSNLPYFARPVLDGLLALNIDLALDAVAIRFGFWDWGQGLDFQYFGVPYANFWAWFWVIFFFSLGWRLFARRRDWIGTWVSPLFALVIGLSGVLGTNALIAFRIPFEYHNLTAITLMVLAIALVTAYRPKFHLTSIPALTFWIPTLTHLYILVAGLIAGVVLDPPFLLLAGFVMLVVSLCLHRPTIRQIISP